MRVLKDVSPESRGQRCAAQPRSKDNNSQHEWLYAAFADSLTEWPRLDNTDWRKQGC
jgi:hypothetical protein